MTGRLIPRIPRPTVRRLRPRAQAANVHSLTKAHQRHHTHQRHSEQTGDSTNVIDADRELGHGILRRELDVLETRAQPGFVARWAPDIWRLEAVLMPASIRIGPSPALKVV